MSNDNLLCKNLSISIWLEKMPDFDQIKIRLVDKVALKKVEQIEVTVEPGANTKNKAYHIQEAIVIGMRKVVHEAFRQGLISLPGIIHLPSPTSERPGPSPQSVPSTRPGVKNITLSMPPDG